MTRFGEAGRARSFASRGPVADQRHQALLLWQYDFPEHAEAVLQPLSDAGDLRSTRYRTDLLPRPALSSSPVQSVESYNPPEARYRLANFLAEHEMVDELRELQQDSRRFIAALQARYATETGCRTLRVKHNHMIGYFVEVPQNVGEDLLKGHDATALRWACASDPDTPARACCAPAR